MLLLSHSFVKSIWFGAEVVGRERGRERRCSLLFLLRHYYFAQCQEVIVLMRVISATFRELARRRRRQNRTYFPRSPFPGERASNSLFPSLKHGSSSFYVERINDFFFSSFSLAGRTCVLKKGRRIKWLQSQLSSPPRQRAQNVCTLCFFSPSLLKYYSLMKDEKEYSVSDFDLGRTKLCVPELRC